MTGFLTVMSKILQQRHAGARGGQDSVDPEHPLVGDHEPIAVLLDDSPQRLHANRQADAGRAPSRPAPGNAKALTKITKPTLATRTAGQALAAQCLLTSRTFCSPAVVKMYLSTCGSSQLDARP